MEFAVEVKEMFDKYIENTVCGKQLNEYQLNAVKEYFQKIFVLGYQTGYSDGENDAWDYEYHGSAADIRQRY